MQRKIPYFAAEKEYEKLKDYFFKNNLLASITGSGRRKKSLLGDIDIVVEGNEDKIHNLMLNYADTEKNLGDFIYKVLSGAEVQIIPENKELFNYTLWHSTGSKEHIKKIKELYKNVNKTINFKFQDEKEIYENIGLNYIPPELRHGNEEFNRKIPKLIEKEDIKGLIHVHTNYSDGFNSLEEMVIATVERGYCYIGISDHSQSAYYAKGLDLIRLKEQFEEIDRLNEKYPQIKILKGTEADIHFDGEMDYGNKILSEFDFVIASIHKGLTMGKKEITKRIIKALKNPHVKILGHLTGKLFLIREGYELDYMEILKVAKEEGKIIELNANPMRLDIDYEKVMLAKDMGVKIAINPDAHNVEGIDNVIYGVNEARRGFAEKKDVINCFDYKEWINKK